MPSVEEKDKNDKILKLSSNKWQPRLFIKIWYKDDNIHCGSHVEEIIQKHNAYYLKD